jgi:type 1 glutamine amidotransferase
MKKTITSFLLIVSIIHAFAQQGKRVLVFTKTQRYHHQSIPAGVKAIQKIGAENNFAVDTTANSACFTEDSLKKYAAVVFLNTSGDVLDTVQQAEFERYIQAGGGLLGIHCASSTEKGWPWYGRLVGAVFTGHPEPQDGVIDVINRTHPATAHLPARWQWHDEWYNFGTIQPGLHVLFKADETTYKGGTNGAGHPLAWYHEYDGGRAFYTALGHFDAAYSDALFIKHLTAGLQYAMGNKVKLNYKKAKTARITANHQ